mmetsp:Transcript_14738/g.21757  ORF Transcript_14738/g.21757 Transcript_14738/m.21757 type:complete len:206 (+) Transcript_14738:656-1273(+)
MKSSTTLRASTVILSSSFSVDDARSIIVIIMQFTTQAKDSAARTLVRPSVSRAFDNASLASSNTNSDGRPGSASTSGNLPGAPKVRIPAKDIQKFGARASAAKSAFKSVSRALASFFENMDAMPFFFFFFGAGGGTTAGCSATGGGTTSVLKSSISDEEASDEGAAKMSSSRVVAAAPLGASSGIPIISLYCSIRFSSSSAAFSL